MARWTLRGYANQVRLFLFLVVLFLVMQGALGFSLLFSARDALSGAVRERASGAARDLAEDLPEGVPPPGVLAAIQRRRDLEAAATLRPDGSVAASSAGPPSAAIDPDYAALSEGERAGFASGREHVRLDVPWGGTARLVVLRPRLRADGGVADLVKVVLRPDDLTALDRKIRSFAVTQAIGVTAVLALTFAFIRWMLRPYRLLVRTAAGALSRETTEEQAIQQPDDLVAAFQGVVDKVQQHERDVARWWTADGSAVPPAGPAFRDLPSGVVVTDRAGLVTALNPAAARLLGVDERAAVGRPCAEALAAAPELARLVGDCLARGTAHRRVLVAIGRGGRASSHVGASVSPIGGDPPEGALCLFSDLTEIREVEEKVRLRESLAEVGEISAGIAHEVRNSLATILGYARLASRSGEAGVRDHAEAICREVEEVRSVLDDYLRFARPVSLNVERFDLGAMAEEVIAALREDPASRGRRLERQGDWPAIEGDEGLLRQALTNLVRNALEAVGDGGRVCVRGELLPGRREVRIEVHDDGPGLPEGVRPEELFRPFFTTKRDGTGLGLALVRKTVVFHDGRIEAGRGPWGGARFTLVLPVAARPGAGLGAAGAVTFRADSP
jgi:PAS domain S-box-containing protein